MLEVVAGVRRQVADFHRRKRRVPPWRVVGPALSGVEDGNQPGLFGVPVGRNVPMPGKGPGVNVVQEARVEKSDLSPSRPAASQMCEPAMAWTGGWHRQLVYGGAGGASGEDAAQAQWSAPG